MNGSAVSERVAAGAASLSESVAGTNEEHDRTWHDRTWQQLATEGYVVVPFLGPAEIEALNRLRVAAIPEVPQGFYISVFASPEARRTILEGFQTILKDKLKTLAPGFSLVTAQFVAKKAHSSGGRLELHQDSTLVDPKKEFGINVWAPLCDVDNHNGCLRVAPRSHRFNLIGCLPPLYGPHAEFERDLVAPCVISLVMKAGEACIFDTRVLHTSEENQSGKDRIAAFFSMIPEGSTPRMYFRNPETPDQLDVFQVDNEFLLYLDPMRYPDAEKRAGMTFLESFGHVQQKLCKADFVALHGDEAVAAEAARAGGGKSKAPSLWSRLWKRRAE